MRLEDKISLGYPDIVYLTQGLFVGIENKSGIQGKITVRTAQIQFANKAIGKGIPYNQYWFWVAHDIFEGVYAYMWPQVRDAPAVVHEKYTVFDLTGIEPIEKLYGPDSLHDWLWIHIWKRRGVEVRALR
jgi:hypothetical protein